MLDFEAQNYVIRCILKSSGSDWLAFFEEGYLSYKEDLLVHIKFPINRSNIWGKAYYGHKPVHDIFVSVINLNDQTVDINLNTAFFNKNLRKMVVTDNNDHRELLKELGEEEDG